MGFRVVKDQIYYFTTPPPPSLPPYSAPGRYFRAFFLRPRPTLLARRTPSLPLTFLRSHSGVKLSN